MKCSLRVWFLSMAFLLVFVMSLLFTYSHHSTATLPYLDSGALDGAPRVKLVPGYAGLQRLSKEGLAGKSCACRRCMGDTGASEWFDSHFNSNISPVWTRENMDLPPDVQRWWMVRKPWPLLPPFWSLSSPFRRPPETPPLGFGRSVSWHPLHPSLDRSQPPGAQSVKGSVSFGQQGERTPIS